MKKLSITLLTNLMLLMAGFIFLIFFNTPHILDWVARIMGVLFLLPSVIFLVILAMRKPENGRTGDFVGVLPSLGGICFGLVMLLRPALFNSVLIMLLGVLLCLLGLFHLFFLLLSYKSLNVKTWYLICPLIVIASGIVIMFWETIRNNESYVVLLTGISLLLFNFTSLQEYMGERKLRVQSSTAITGSSSADEEESKLDIEI